MSHHFDTPTAREDPRMNVNDFYLFEGAPGTTVMAMTVNPDAGLSAPTTLREEGLYAFRFDLDGDAREEVTFKFRFGQITQGNARRGDGRPDIQDYVVLHATGEDARRAAGGQPLFDGDSETVLSQSGIRAFVGLAPELFAGDAAGLRGFMTAFYAEQKFKPEAFANGHDFFARRNVTAIVLEVPSDLIAPAGTTVHAWATASLVGHAPEVQVSRWGLPLITHIFLSAPAEPASGNRDLKEEFNRSIPSEDVARFSAPIAEFARRVSTLAGTANPREYGNRLATRLCPTTLPYTLGTPAAFDFTGFNGRALGHDVMDIMLTLTSNRPIADTAAPDRQRIRNEFPYFGSPCTPDEQADVIPAAQPKKK